MGTFEAMTLICFGIRWPSLVAKSVRTREVSGKTLFFIALVCLGYLSGIIHKALFADDWMIYLYALSTMMMAIGLVDYFRYSPARGGCV